MSNSYLLQVCIEASLVIMCLSIWLCTCIQMRSYKPSEIIRYLWFMILIVSGILIADIAAIWYRGNESTLGYYAVRVSNFFVFILIRSLLLYTAVFVQHRLAFAEQGKRLLVITKVLIGFSFALLTINLFVPIVYGFDSTNHYFRMNGWYALSVIDIVSTAMVLTQVIRGKELLETSEQIYLYISIIAPLAAAAIQMFIYGISLLTIIIGITQIVLFFISCLNTSRNLTQKEAEVAEYSARLTLSQLQPHFLMNALSAVQYLCKTSPEEAAATIADLNVYIRNNMEFSKMLGTIPFAREMDHIEKYIAIERKRFGNRIRLETQIEEHDFMIPPLTVQPLVENAVKHGISKKRGGGTVTVRTWKEADCIGIRVSDDGIGFDPSAGFSEDRIHFGMMSVRERLERQYGGTMSVASAPDEGTTIELRIPIEM